MKKIKLIEKKNNYITQFERSTIIIIKYAIRVIIIIDIEQVICTAIVLIVVFAVILILLLIANVIENDIKSFCNI